MTPEEICHALEEADAHPPTAALTAGVACAKDLAPAVTAVLEEAAQGVYLLPAQENLFMAGLHIMAAARERSVWPAWLRFLERPEHEIANLLGEDYDVQDMGRITFTLVDSDVEPVLSLVERRGIAGSVRWACFGVLARLTGEGRFPRPRLVELLRRFADGPLAEDDDQAWLGWQDAVSDLGLIELKDRLQDVLQKPAFHWFREIDRDDAFERLQATARNPERARDNFLLDTEPIDDPLESLRRFLPETEDTGQTEEADDEEADDEGEDAVRDIRLTDRELNWLAGFLLLRLPAQTATPLELVDGFFTALTLGPAPIPLAERVARIWGGGELGEPPNFQSSEQADYVLRLLARHCETVERRWQAGQPFQPLIDEISGVEPGTFWAMGFVAGVERKFEIWEPLLQHEEARAFFLGIAQLAQDDPEIYEQPLTGKDRAEVLKHLPQILYGIGLFWDGDWPAPEPRRVTKVGRNEPCPCGSGKKYKRCCGTG